MEMRYQKLFEKGYIGGVESRNRVAMTAIGNGLASTEMTKEEIGYIIKKFVAAAVNCQKAGIDGVELHAAHEIHQIDEGVQVGQHIAVRPEADQLRDIVHQGLHADRKSVV